ncbi:hypothetical protein SFRURICE_003842 [Spodoptera frugiperda]|nr:hypothetical protein SFRURICE_003842 [Spodoptera frugiperda]
MYYTIVICEVDVIAPSCRDTVLDNFVSDIRYIRFQYRVSTTALCQSGRVCPLHFITALCCAVTGRECSATSSYYT